MTAWFLKAQDCINDWSMVSWLLDGLCLFGDNAYINSPYMAMPYKNVSGGSRDDYNNYHSQLQIRVECAFGMLAMRWRVEYVAGTTSTWFFDKEIDSPCQCTGQSYTTFALIAGTMLLLSVQMIITTIL